MRQCTLLLLKNEQSLLLAMKKRGFGKGRWNGVGGKIEPGESIEEGLIRECQEEINVTPTAYQQVGILDFFFSANQSHDQRVHVYFATKWKGQPSESEEMAPKWFDISDIPYDDMWPDDILWLPEVLSEKLVYGEFTFNDNDELTKHNLEIITAQKLNAIK